MLLITSWTELVAAIPRILLDCVRQLLRRVPKDE